MTGLRSETEDILFDMLKFSRKGSCSKPLEHTFCAVGGDRLCHGVSDQRRRARLEPETLGSNGSYNELLILKLRSQFVKLEIPNAHRVPRRTRFAFIMVLRIISNIVFNQMVEPVLFMVVELRIKFLEEVSFALFEASDWIATAWKYRRLRSSTFW